jgi:hypothetical protein
MKSVHYLVDYENSGGMTKTWGLDINLASLLLRSESIDTKSNLRFLHCLHWLSPTKTNSKKHHDGAKGAERKLCDETSTKGTIL